MLAVYTVDEFGDAADGCSSFDRESRQELFHDRTGLTNERQGDKIIGLNENTEEKEGLIRFDIVFCINERWTHADHYQCGSTKDDPDEYDILNRAITYVSRVFHLKRNGFCSSTL